MCTMVALYVRALVSAGGGTCMTHHPSHSRSEISSMPQISSTTRASPPQSDVAKDESVSVVLLRVNSPGGSAAASELIARKIQEMK